jgi:hypothetical protein
MVRALLSEAANALLTRVQRWSWLKRWGVNVARRRGKLRAQVAKDERSVPSIVAICAWRWDGCRPSRRHR